MPKKSPRELAPSAAPELPGKLVTVLLQYVDRGHDLRPRAERNEAKIQEYAALLREGETLPPPIAYSLTDRGLAQCVIVDGDLRIEARLRVDPGLKRIELRKLEGDHADALWCALGANAKHGLPLSNADKRRAAELALKGFPQNSLTAIAKHLGVSVPFIGNVSRDLGMARDQVITAGGRHMNTALIGRSSAKAKINAATINGLQSPGPDTQRGSRATPGLTLVRPPPSSPPTGTPAPTDHRRLSDAESPPEHKLRRAAPAAETTLADACVALELSLPATDAESYDFEPAIAAALARLAKEEAALRIRREAVERAATFVRQVRGSGPQAEGS